MTPADYQGTALVIGAAAAFVASVGGMALQFATFLRQGAMMRAGVTRDAKIDQVHDLVNGQSVALNEALTKVAFSAGEKAGGDTERARSEPTVPPRVEP